MPLCYFEKDFLLLKSILKYIISHYTSNTLFLLQFGKYRSMTRLQCKETFLSSMFKICLYYIEFTVSVEGSVIFYVNFYFKFLERHLTNLYVVSAADTKNNVEPSLNCLWCIVVHCVAGSVIGNSFFHYLFRERLENFVLRHAS
jgi:hypothetical protein